MALSDLLLQYARTVGNLQAADQSLSFSPQNAESHLVRGQILKGSGDVGDSIVEFQRAVALRPRDYYVWLELGLACDENEDASGALVAFGEAVRLAPHYAEPHWQRGNFLLRVGNYNEAFSDLRFAAVSNPALLPNLIDLAWGFASGDPELAVRLAQLTSDERAAFALFLARRGRGKEAYEQFAQAGNRSDALRDQLVKQLIAIDSIPEAFKIWQGTNTTVTNNGTTIFDGGFEAPLKLAEAGFNWQFPSSMNGVNLSQDTDRPHSGSKSLRIEFAGGPSAESTLVSQLLVVHPSHMYRVSFAARTRDLVSGGLPLLVVNDASGVHKRLAESPTLPGGTNPWRNFAFEFTAAPRSNGAILALQREKCAMSPCPIFGYLWLDSLSIELISEPH